ncbi:GNAT family N-acetyltransferase [Agromyces sp. LHK192]|uniref:GNAT family N-acetyltransferase n=1 Tax=Agromyces sp. LHK192 TaxID=2498704 RepID=UPI0013E38128|nr:GNAT family N-acetyltransferase [Agromyces sp. LHK192]
MDTTTSPLSLHPFTLDDARRIRSGELDPADGWEGGYSFIDEPELIDQYVAAVLEDGDPAPFGPHLVRRGADGAAIGGVNLFGPADADGAVEFAFGLVPAVRGQGLSVHAVVAAVDIIRAAGGRIARAEAEIANVPARRALEAAGLAEASRHDDVIVYEQRL